MKKTLMLAAVLTLGHVAFAQGEVIDNSKVSVEELKEVFENAYMEVLGTDANYIIVKDKYSIFVTLYDENKRYIEYILFNGFVEGASKDDKLMLANTINQELIEVSAYVDFENDQIVFKYDLWIEGGVAKGDIIKSFKAFQNTLTASVMRDRQHILK